MKTNEMINILKMSSIKGLAVGSSTKNTVKHEARLLSYLSRAINMISSDLQLMQDGIMIEVVAGVDEYELPDNCISVVSVELDPSGQEVPLNDSSMMHSVFTPDPNTIYVPDEFIGLKLIVYFNKTHDILVLDKRFPLPNVYTEAVVFYVSYLANELIHSKPNWEHQSFLTKYKTEISRLRAMGVVPNRAIINRKLHQRGYR